MVNNTDRTKEPVVQICGNDNLSGDGNNCSLAEGMEETLTVHKLGLKGDLKRILSSTNSIESMFSMSRRYSRNVKKWNRKTNHIERTLVVTLLEAESRFRRVRGYKELKELQSKIRNLRATTCNTKAA
jgi:hypothetical protein